MQAMLRPDLQKWGLSLSTLTELREVIAQSQPDDGPQVVFFDEAHLHIGTDVGHGWAPRGQRLVCEFPLAGALARKSGPASVYTFWAQRSQCRFTVNPRPLHPGQQTAESA